MKGWVRGQLGALTTKIGSGATPRGGEESYKTSGTPFIRSLNVYDAGFRYRSLAYLDATQASALSNVEVRPADVLLNITGASVARCCLVPNDICPARVNQHVSIIRPIQEKLDPSFLHYLLTSPANKRRLLQTGEDNGSTRQAITKAQIESFTIEFPESIREQQRIVAILDEAFEAIATAKANTEKNLQNARALFESVAESIFLNTAGTGRSYSLGQIANFRNGINFTRNSKGDAVRIVGVKDFQNYFSAPLESLDTVSVDGTISVADLVEENDILFVRSNGNKELIGRCMLIGPLSERTTHSGFTIRARIHEDVSHEYICRFLKSKATRERMIKGGSGSNINNLNQTTLSELSIPLPPKNIQIALASELAHHEMLCDELANSYRQKSDALDHLKASLLHQAFTGNL
jgi:type I restriction enzyme S subunit